jgi:hypothetical protein
MEASSRVSYVRLALINLSLRFVKSSRVVSFANSNATNTITFLLRIFSNKFDELRSDCQRLMIECLQS